LFNSTYSSANYTYQYLEAIVGSTYQAENKDYSKIETIGIAGYFNDANPNLPWTLSNEGPQTFKVTSKDGYIREYTVNPNEYDYLHGYPLTWYLKKITDTNGNYISCDYLTSENQTILKSIAYTGSTTTAPFDSIVFNYNTKVASYTYVGSTKIANKFLLDNIQIKNNSTLLKQYNFTYISRKNKYYINDVTLTGQNNLKLNSTAFEWGNDNTVIAVNKLSVPTLPQTVNAADRHWLSADVNGDGLSDAINIYPVTTTVGGVPQTKNYLQVFKAVMVSGQVSFVADANYDVGNNFSYTDLKAVNPSIRFADLYGKNKEEIIIPQLSTSGGNTISFNILGVGTLQQTLQASNVIPAYAVGDINNDGKEEIIYFEKGKVNNSYYPGKIGYNINGQTVWEDIQFPVYAIPGIPKAIFISDFNADGLKDLMILTDTGYCVYKNSGGSKQTDGITHVSFPSDGSCVGSLFNATCSMLKSGDFNGDGLLDFIFVGQGGGSWNMAVGTPAMQFSLTSTAISSAKSTDISNYFDNQKDCIVTDYNHDGKADVILIDPTYNYSSTEVIFDVDMPTHYIYAGTTSTWYSFNGSNFVIDKKSTIASPQSSYPYTTSLLNSYFTTLGDFDGDGREDILTYGADMYNGVDKSDRLYLHNSYNTNFEANLLKSVTNGFGKKTTISYQPLTYATTANNKPFYTKGSSSAYPVCDLQMPLYCVSNISEPNGQGGSLTTDFSYAEARTQLTGVGFLGFKSQTASNASANKKTTTTTDLNLSYYLPDKITQDVSTVSSNAISKTETFINNTLTGNIFESLRNKVVQTDYLTGLSNTTEYPNYDGYGNPATIKTTQGNVISTQTTAYVQKGSWCPNKPGSITVTKVKDGESYTRHVDYSYDDKGNLTGQTVDAGDANQQSVAYSQFNAFGQPTKAQITANGNTRTASISTTPSGRFIQSQTNVLGQTITYSWDEPKIRKSFFIIRSIGF
jgi:hypothetical protein